MQIFNLYLKHNIQIISNQWCGTREQQIDKVVSLVCYVHGREPNVDKNTAPNYRLLLLIMPDRSCTELFPSLQRYLHRRVCFIYLRTIYWMMTEDFQDLSLGHFRSTLD